MVPVRAGASVTVTAVGSMVSGVAPVVATRLGVAPMGCGDVIDWSSAHAPTIVAATSSTMGGRRLSWDAKGYTVWSSSG